MDQDSDFAQSTHIFSIKSSACKDFLAQGFKPVSSKPAVLRQQEASPKTKTKEPAYLNGKGIPSHGTIAAGSRATLNMW